MFKEDEIGVGFSKWYTVEDYTTLDLSMESVADDWNRAIEIFRDRIQSRYLNQISELKGNIENNAFSIMAIESLLIEVFLQFREGWDETSRGKNRTSYVKFLHEWFESDFCFVSDFNDEKRRNHEHIALENLVAPRNNWEKYRQRKSELIGRRKAESPEAYVYRMSMDPAERFYCDIRCGILHSGQTKGETGLCIGREHAVEIVDGILFVSVDQFVKIVEEYFQKYLQELHNPCNFRLRNNFINKMDCVCYRNVSRKTTV